MSNEITPQSRAKQLLEKYIDVIGASTTLGMSEETFRKILRGGNSHPTEAVLSKIGLRRRISYELIPEVEQATDVPKPETTTEEIISIATISERTYAGRFRVEWSSLHRIRKEVLGSLGKPKDAHSPVICINRDGSFCSVHLTHFDFHGKDPRSSADFCWRIASEAEASSLLQKDND